MLSQEPWNSAVSCTDTWEVLGQKSVAKQHSGWLSDYPSWWGHSAKPELLRVHSVCDLSCCTALIQSLPVLNVKRVVTDKISPEQSGRGMTAALPKGERFPSSSLYCVWLLGESVPSCPVAAGVRAHPLTSQHWWGWSVNLGALLITSQLESFTGLTESNGSLHYHRLWYDFLSDNICNSQSILIYLFFNKISCGVCTSAQGYLQ